MTPSTVLIVVERRNIMVPKDSANTNKYFGIFESNLFSAFIYNTKLQLIYIQFGPCNIIAKMRSSFESIILCL